MVIVPPALLALAVAATPAHPLHTTLATVEWLGERRELAVAVRVFTQDLAAAARPGTASVAGGTVSDSAACRYATQLLSIQDGAGSLPVARCLAEQAADITWIRWSVPARSALGLSIRSALLFECFADQVNLVQTNLAGTLHTILFTRGDGPKTLS